MNLTKTMPLVLLIEDENILRKNTQELLEMSGYRCVAAKNGREGLRLATDQNPDIIVCDILMPYLNGFEVKKHLNGVHHLSNIPFIYITAKSERADLRDGMDLGASDFIVKPYKTSDLLNSIERRLLQRASWQQETNINLKETISNLFDIVIEERKDNPTMFPETASSVAHSGQSLFKILNNLIDLLCEKHYNTKKIHKNKSYELGKKINQVALQQANYYKRTNDLIFSSDIITCTQFLEMDAVILFNELIENAFRFSTPGSSVEVILKQGKDGKGIQAKIINILPDSSTSLNPVLTAKQIKQPIAKDHGWGIGLVISKMICSDYQGYLNIDAENTSATIQVTIPNT